MLKQLCLLLLLPSLAMAGRNAVPRPGAALAADLPRSFIADPAAGCETAVALATSSNRLPPGLLQAISLTESGRSDPASGRLRAWPWTINAGGEGRFFATRQDAIDAVRTLWARGVQSIDVGCMQVNLLYHPHAFASLEQAFDPRANASYAATFLMTLHAMRKDWAPAIAAYHSEVPARGDAYRMLVLLRWQNPGGAPAKSPDAPVPEAAYRDFAPIRQVYGAFAPAAHVYGAFPGSR